MKESRIPRQGYPTIGKIIKGGASSIEKVAETTTKAHP